MILQARDLERSATLDREKKLAGLLGIGCDDLVHFRIRCHVLVRDRVSKLRDDLLQRTIHILHRAGAARVFKSDCASATLGPAGCLLPLLLLPPAPGDSPIGISAPIALFTAMERLGDVGCGITSASTITL